MKSTLTATVLVGLLLINLCPTPAASQPTDYAEWIIPKIGKLQMPPIYWQYCIEAGQQHQVDPYVIAGVMAIESRFKPNARSGLCRGLMQLHLDTARVYGVNPYNPRENVFGGAAVLADLLKKFKGNLRRAVRAYNGTGNRAYENEVMKAIRQAKGRK